MANEISRRRFITGIAGILVAQQAPGVVRAASMMKIIVPKRDIWINIPVKWSGEFHWHEHSQAYPYGDIGTGYYYPLLKEHKNA